MHYYAKITKDDGAYLVTFPDCEGCLTCGDTRAEARAAAAEALEGWLESHLAHGEAPPRPVSTKGDPIRVPPRVSMTLQLRWARQDLSWTQAQLAAAAGVSQQAVAKLEHPDANPTIGTLAKVAAALGRELEVVLSATA